MILTGEALDCVRGERLVFAGLDFRLAPGGLVLLHGPNGSGKSSLLRLVAGLLKPAAGRLAWDGRDAAGDPEAHRARLAYVGHLDALKPGLTVRDNLVFWSRFAGAGAAAVPAALARLGLAELAELPARLLSAGQRRRLNLARLLTAPATLWLLDEPTTALDRDGVAAFAALVAEHRARGGMVMAATHVDLGLADARVIDLAREAAR